MFPVRCYTCNAVLANLYVKYESDTRSGISEKTSMDSLGVHRMCCRRMFLGHVDLVEDLVKYPNDDLRLDDAGTVMHRRVHGTHKVTCD